MARKRRRFHWQRETDLAAQVVAWFRAEGWIVYQEIAGIDIVAVKDGIRWAIEAKRSWNLKVLAQAHANLPASHRSSIAVPASFLDSEERFGLRIAKQFGLGVLLVKRPDAQGRSTLQERLKPEERRQTDGSLDKWLVPRAEDHAEAGSAAASSWTPFKETCARLADLLAETEPMLLSEALEQVDHHYKSVATGSANLRKAVQQSPQLGLRVEKKRNRWYIARQG